MNRFAADAPAATPGATAASAAEPPSFAERARRVEVPVGDVPVRPSAGAGTPGEPETFAEQMRRVVVRGQEGLEGLARTDEEAAARGAAEQMVATLFIQPLLDMALESSQGGLMAPGQGEKTFGPMMNQRLADEIVRKADLPIVDSVVQTMLERGRPAASGTLTRTRAQVLEAVRAEAAAAAAAGSTADHVTSAGPDAPRPLAEVTHG